MNTIKEPLHILMADDHPLIIEGYKNVLSEHFKEIWEVNIQVAYNCDEAFNLLKKNTIHKPFHLALIDVEMPASETHKRMISGESIAKYIKDNYPDTGVMILTMHSDPNRVQTILEAVNPDAFLIKSDISARELAYACNQVLDDKSYYSMTVNNLLRNIVTNRIVLDAINRQILYFLAEGVLTKDLVKHINLSLSAIEKRKNVMKELFGISSANDRLLIAEAKKKGFI